MNTSPLCAWEDKHWAVYDFPAFYGNGIHLQISSSDLTYHCNDITEIKETMKVCWFQNSDAIHHYAAVWHIMQRRHEYQRLHRNQRSGWEAENRHILGTLHIPSKQDRGGAALPTLRFEQSRGCVKKCKVSPHWS